MFLIEVYVIYGNGTWSLIDTMRFDMYDKRKYITYAKKVGYKYNRKEKAYIAKAADTDGYTYDHAIQVTKYAM